MLGPTARRCALPATVLLAAGVLPTGRSSSFSLLAPPQLATECSCGEAAGQGWVGSYGMCMKGTSTPCAVCPHQKKCAEIRTVVGDGIRAFLGDCRSSSANTCLPAKESSLAFPIGIAIDRQDNLYIADYGNNRIRMWSSRTNTLVTIAGTGEIGFSGDGGEARQAKLRQPEGIAVKPGHRLAAEEVYFSDFKNQRIRRLTLIGDVWHIDTVAGNGVRGDSGTACDIGCNATTQANLDNPRAIAFSSAKDLYIVDSGNRKIRKLTPDGVFSTFVGTNGPAPAEDSFTGHGKKLLPGHWEQPVKSTTLGSLYFLNIDVEDNLWFVDGSNNRLWQAPLDPRPRLKLQGVFSRYMANFLLHFAASTPAEVSALEQQMVAGFTAWGPAMLPNQTVSAAETDHVTLEYGMATWRFAGTGPSWCKRFRKGTRDHCGPAVAQYTSFDSVMGLCFDAANNMYISDKGSSEILYLTRYMNAGASSSGGFRGQRVTTNRCICHQYWFEDLGTEEYDHELTPDMCRESPAMIAMVERVKTHNLARGDKLWVTSLEKLPHCDATNYCSSGATGVERCMIEPGSEGPCQRKWGFCSKPGLGVSWEMIPYAAVLGNELRIPLVRSINLQYLTSIINDLTQDLWYQPAVQPEDPGLGFLSVYAGTSILAGFVSVEPWPESCSSACCGLPELQQSTGSMNDISTPGGPRCALRNKDDVTVLQDFFDNHTTMTIIWHTLEHITSINEGGGSENHPESQSLEDCQDRCMLDPKCKSFMVAYNQTSNRTAATSACIYSSQNWPYYVYQFDRSGFNDSQVGSSNLEELRSRFKEEITAYSRLFNTGNDIGLYVTSTGYHAPHMLPTDGGPGPYADGSLNLVECKDKCINTPGCNSIAFPGCYLLSKSNVVAQSSTNSQATASAVFVKKYMDHSIEGIAGSPQVYAFQGDGDALRHAYLNRPASCVVNSRGENLFVDVWNQRIRKISGYNLDCLHAAEANKQQYIEALNRSYEVCSSPRMAALYSSLQQRVLEQRSAEPLGLDFCEFQAPVDPEYLETNNSFVLCSLCTDERDELRPEICPWLEFCDCHDSLLAALQTAVYTQCVPKNAYYDNWHLWLSSYSQCFIQKPEDASWMTNSTSWERLKNKLKTYDRRRRGLSL